MFDLDELKRDISTSDAKFAVGKYTPTALILEYLTSRATMQQVPLPSFMLLKSTAVKKKRASDAQVDNNKSVSGKEGNGPFWIRMQKRTMSKMTNRTMMSKMPKILMQ